MKDNIVYDGWGNVISESDVEFGGRYKWTGREVDVETELQYNRARYYDGEIGRWISRDPLGVEAGDSNLYRYVKNRMTAEVDASGLAPVPSLDPNPVIGTGMEGYYGVGLVVNLSDPTDAKQGGFLLLRISSFGWVFKAKRPLAGWGVDRMAGRIGSYWWAVPVPKGTKGTTVRTNLKFYNDVGVKEGTFFDGHQRIPETCGYIRRYYDVFFADGYGVALEGGGDGWRNSTNSGAFVHPGNTINLNMNWSPDELKQRRGGENIKITCEPTTHRLLKKVFLPPPHRLLKVSGNRQQPREQK